MAKKIKLVNILISIACVILGVLFLYNHYTFYSQAKIAQGAITGIKFPRAHTSSRGSYLSRDVSFTFKDAEGRPVSTTKEISTITLVSGVFMVGDKIKVLYKKAPVALTMFDGLVKNIGTPAYDTKIYTWHYWVYPILLILLGPVWYWAAIRLGLINKK